MYWHTKVSGDITDSRCTCSNVLRKLKITTDVLTHTNVHLLRKMKITDIRRITSLRELKIKMDLKY